jgi:hypothetical protein
MLALVCDRTKLATIAFILFALTSLVSCATKEPTRLVSDPSDRPESAIPWNKQEKWEIGAGIPNMLGETR